MSEKKQGLEEDYILSKVTIEIKDSDNIVYKLSFKPYRSDATADELKYKQTQEQMQEFCEVHGIPLDFNVLIPAMNRIITITTSKTQRTIDEFNDEEEEGE